MYYSYVYDNILTVRFNINRGRMSHGGLIPNPPKKIKNLKKSTDILNTNNSSLCFFYSDIFDVTTLRFEFDYILTKITLVLLIFFQ